MNTKYVQPGIFTFFTHHQKRKKCLQKQLIIDKIKPQYWFIDFTSKNVIEIMGLENAVSCEFKMAGREKMLIWSNLKNWKRARNCKFTVEDLLDAVNVVCFR